MRRAISILILILVASVVSAQNESAAPQVAAAEQVVSAPKTDWLTPFTRVKVNGPMNVVFKKVDRADGVRIIYDTKGNITSKFKFEVDRNGVLVVSEKQDPKRTTVTEITIYYHTLSDVKINKAKAEFEDVLECK